MDRDTVLQQISTIVIHSTNNDILKYMEGFLSKEIHDYRLEKLLSCPKENLLHFVNKTVEITSPETRDKMAKYHQKISIEELANTTLNIMEVVNSINMVGLTKPSWAKGLELSRDQVTEWYLKKVSSLGIETMNLQFNHLLQLAPISAEKLN